MNDCLFCKIIAGEIPSKKIYEDELCYAFYDITPQAPTHFLVIPKRHLDSLAEIGQDSANIIGHIFTIIPKLARELGLESYRVVNNCGPDAGQTVFHLHFHVLGGHRLTDRMA